MIRRLLVFRCCAFVSLKIRRNILIASNNSTNLASTVTLLNLGLHIRAKGKVFTKAIRPAKRLNKGRTGHARARVKFDLCIRTPHESITVLSHGCLYGDDLTSHRGHLKKGHELFLEDDTAMPSVTSKHSAGKCVLQRILPRFRLRTLWPTICFRYQVKRSR